MSPESFDLRHKSMLLDTNDISPNSRLIIEIRFSAATLYILMPYKIPYFIAHQLQIIEQKHLSIA